PVLRALADHLAKVHLIGLVPVALDQPDAGPDPLHRASRLPEERVQDDLQLLLLPGHSFTATTRRTSQSCLAQRYRLTCGRPTALAYAALSSASAYRLASSGTVSPVRSST